MKTYLLMMLSFGVSFVIFSTVLQAKPKMKRKLASNISRFFVENITCKPLGLVEGVDLVFSNPKMKRIENRERNGKSQFVFKNKSIAPTKSSLHFSKKRVNSGKFSLEFSTYAPVKNTSVLLIKPHNKNSNLTVSLKTWDYKLFPNKENPVGYKFMFGHSKNYDCVVKLRKEGE